MARKAKATVPGVGDPSGAPTAGRRAGGERTVRRLNRRLILVLFLATLVSGAGVHALHAFMVDRNADHLKARAEQAEKDGDAKTAVRLFAQYLNFEPDDLDAKERYAELLPKVEDTPRGWLRVQQTLEDILRKDPGRGHLRRPAIDAALKIGRYSDAADHIERLLAKEQPEGADPDAWRREQAELIALKAVTEVASGRERQAAVLYARAISLDEQAVKPYAELATLLVTRPNSLPSQEDIRNGLTETSPKSTGAGDGDPRDARKGGEWIAALFPESRAGGSAEQVAAGLLDEMVRRAKPEWQAYEARAQHRQGRGDLDGASADFRVALQAPESAERADLLFAAAAVEAARTEKATADRDEQRAAEYLADARRYAEAGLKAEPSDSRFHLILAEIELAAGATPEAFAAAERRLREGLAQAETVPDEAAWTRWDAEAAPQLRWRLATLFAARAAVEPGRVGDFRKEIRSAVDALRKLRWRPERVDYLECRLSLLDRNWSESAGRLESLRPRLLNDPDLQKEVDLLLAACYERLEDRDRRVEALRRAAAADPLSEPTRLALAQALRDAGRVDEAVREYDRVANAPGAASERARLVLVRELGKPADRRDLAIAEAAVAAAEKAAPGTPEAVRLRAQLLAMRGDYATADDLLAGAAEAAPEASDVWQTRLLLAATRGDKPAEERAAAAERLLAEGEARFGDTVEVRLAKAELARRTAPETLPLAVERLSADVEGFSPDDRVRLYEGLARYARGSDGGRAALELWRKIAAIRKDSLRAWLTTAQLAGEAGDEGGLRTALAEVRRLEGPEGPLGDFVEATWTVGRLAQNPDLRKDETKLKAELDDARTLLTRAGKQRKEWSAVPRALGILESLAGNVSAATEQFLRAYELGDRSVEVVRALVRHHRAQGQPDRAAAVLREAEERTPGVLAAELGREAWQVALENGRIDEAVAIAGQLAERSSDFHDRIVHGHVLYTKYRLLPEAERNGENGKRILAQSTDLFRKVAEEVPQEPDAWIALAAHLHRTGDPDAAAAAAAEAERKLPAGAPAARHEALARTYDAAGQADRAAEHYRKAVDAAPDDAELRVKVANFFLGKRAFDEADSHLAWLLDPTNKVSPAVVAQARRARAIATAARGRYEDVTRALAMLREDAAGGEVSVDDLRAQLAVLAGRVTVRDQRQVIGILEQIRSKSEAGLTDDERLRLAALYEQTGQWPKAVPILEDLVESTPSNPTYLAVLILGTVKHETLDEPSKREIERQIEKLKVLSPGDAGVRLVAAEAFSRLGRVADAEAELRAVEAKATAADGRGGAAVTDLERAELFAAAQTAQRLKFDAVAESLYRRYAETTTKPEEALQLAVYLGERARFAEALDVVERHAAQAPPEATAIAAVGVVAVGAPPADQLARAEALVARAVEQAPNSGRTLSALAGLRTVQERYDEAEAIYRRVLAEQPADAASLNNLAWLLAVSGKDAEEASRLIEEAIAIAGPLPELVDTRGIIDLARGRVEQAVRDLSEAFADTPTANIGFHLALAYDRLGNRDEARKRLREAHDLGLNIGVLHASEHDLYKKLVMRLGP